MEKDSELVMVKKCTKCKIEKTEDSFAIYRGLRKTICRPCRIDYEKSWYEKNKEKVREQKRQRYINNRDKYLQDTKDWQKNNPEKAAIVRKSIKARRRCSEGSYSIEEIQYIFSRQNGCCNYCKIDINQKYHIDHIIPIKLGGNNYSLNIQLLCPPCNFSKAAYNPLDHEKSIGFERKIIYDLKNIYFLKNIDGLPKWRAAPMEAF